MSTSQRSAAGEEPEQPARLAAAATIRRVLDSNFWRYSCSYVVTIEPVSRVDYWIRVDGPEPAGCAVLLADGADLAADTARISAVIEALDRSDVRYQAAVVVLSADLVAADHNRIRDAFGGEPLVYLAPSFEADFTAAVKAMLHRVGRSGDAALAVVPDRIDRIDRSQVRTQRLLAHLASEVKALRTAVDTPGRATTPRDLAAAGRRLPEPVARLFDRILRDLDELSSTSGVVRSIFDIRPDAPDSLTAIRQIRNAPEEPLSGLGCAQLLRSVITVFRGAIERWFAGVPTTPGTRLGEPEQRELQLLCRRFDDASSALPVRELYGLRRLPQGATATAGGSGGSERIERTHIGLQRLGNDVQEAALLLFANQ